MEQIDKKPEVSFEKSALYQELEQFLLEKLGEKRSNMKHFQGAASWMFELDPKADEAELIAALGHDAERVLVRDKMSPEIKADYHRSFKGEKFLTYHQEMSAQLLGEFLKERGASDELIEKVKHMVSKHEVGGDGLQNLLKDADSLSFFGGSTEIFIAKHIKAAPKENIREKFDWMFERITSEEAKNIARPMYEEAIVKLEQAK